MVLGVVVAVGRRDVEHHAPEGLGARTGSQAQPIDDVEELRVVMRADLPKVELAQSRRAFDNGPCRRRADGHSDGS